MELSRITFPYLLLICLAALVSGVLNGLDRFTAASASYVLFNVVSIACMLWLTPYVPTAGHALSWGITVSGVAQLGLLLWALRRGGMGLSLPRPRLTPQIRVLLRRMLPGLVGAGVTQLNLAVDVIIASLLPAGTVSVLYYADRVQQLPLGVIGTAVGTALLPLLSRQVRGGEAEAARTTLNRAIEYALFLTLPAAVALIVSAWPVMSALFGRGAFDAESARLSSQSLAAYALGLPAFVLVKVLAPGLLRPRRYGDTGKDRCLRGGAEPRDERRLHGAAEAYRAGARDQPCRRVQRRLAGRAAGAARASDVRCTAAPEKCADRGGGGGDGCGTVAGTAGVVLGAAAWGAADRRADGIDRRWHRDLRDHGDAVRSDRVAGLPAHGQAPKAATRRKPRLSHCAGAAGRPPASGTRCQGLLLPPCAARRL